MLNPIAFRQAKIKKPRIAIGFAVLAGGIVSQPASATLRIANYNIDADTDRNGDTFINGSDATYSVAAIARVIEAMGSYDLAGHHQGIDALTLQELYSVPATTLTPHRSPR